MKTAFVCCATSRSRCEMVFFGVFVCIPAIIYILTPNYPQVRALIRAGFWFAVGVIFLLMAIR